MAVRAMSKAVGISPKRLFPLVEVVRGKLVDDALEALRFLPGPAAAQLSKVVRSAKANAENNLMLNPNRLRVVRATADPGPVTKRFRARCICTRHKLLFFKHRTHRIHFKSTR